MKPHADWACNSAKCKTKKGAAVYDLPVNATRCPVCGSRRIIRLFSAPNISRGISKKSDSVLEPEYLRQRAKKDAAKEAQRQAPMIAVDPNGPGGLSGGIARATGFNLNVGSPGASRPTLGISSPDLAGLKGAGMNRLTPGSVKKWTPSADDMRRAQ